MLNDLFFVIGDSVLISDGMFRIEMYADTEKLRIKKGEGIEVTFPRSTKENMDLFYHTFKNLPAKQNIKVLAMGYHDTIPFISEKDLFIERKLSHELIFKQTTEEDLTKKLNSL